VPLSAVNREGLGDTAPSVTWGRLLGRRAGVARPSSRAIDRTCLQGGEVHVEHSAYLFEQALAQHSQQEFSDRSVAPPRRERNPGRW
jgi:hypothetical protein